jgi:twinkle protein
VLLPKNDANACLQEEVKKEEIDECFNNATSFDPEQLQSPDSFKEKLIARIFPTNHADLGYGSPWSKFNDKIFFDKSGLSVWTGVNGHGKTQFLNHLSVHWMHEGAKVCIASLELDPDETLQNMLPVLSLKNTNPRLDNLISKEYALKCLDWLNNDRLYLYNEFGGANAKNLIDVFQYAHRKYGINIFVIDSLSLININDDDYNAQAQFVRDLVKFKKNNDCHIHLVVHPRKGADENQNPGKFDFRGSGTITNLADNCFSVSRNKLKESATELQKLGETLNEAEIKRLAQADCYVHCMKQRKGGHEGKFGFWLDLTAKQYISRESACSIRYVEYSSND